MDNKPLFNRLAALMRLNMVLILLMLCGCATEVFESEFKVSTPLTSINYPEGLKGVQNVLIIGFIEEGGQCVRNEIKSYLENSKNFKIFDSKGLSNDRNLEEFIGKNNINLIISGEINKLRADSNVQDRNTAIDYFSAFIITAPIAGAVAANSEWEAYAIASAKMSVLDTSTDEKVWEKVTSVGINEEGDNIVKEDTVKEVLLPLVCKNLARKMMNDFLNSYISLNRNSEQ
jgi:hypothetical protein